METRIYGKVLWYSPRDNNGVIVSERNEYYFDVSTLTDRAYTPIREDIVAFDTSIVDKVLCAKNVNYMGTDKQLRDLKAKLDIMEKTVLSKGELK